jgi:tripartite ATP-independent transporter DctP family solute receptor
MRRNALALITAVALTAATSGSALAQQYRIKFAHPAPTSDPAHRAAQLFAERIAERTGKKVQVTVFPGGQLGKENEIIQGLQSGAIEMCFFSSTHLVNSVPEFGVLDLPYLVTDNEAVGRLLGGEIGKTIMAKLPAVGIRGLAYSESSFRNVFTKRPADSIEQLKGLKLRVPNSPVYVGTIRAMGALPTPIPFGELYTALQQGIVDGAETSGSAFWNYKFYEVGKHWLVTKHTVNPGVYLMSEKFWQTLPLDVQKTIHETAVEAGLQHRNWSWEEDDKGLQSAQERGGVQVHVVKDLKPVAQKARALYPEFAQKIGQGLVDQAVAAFPSH